MQNHFKTYKKNYNKWFVRIWVSFITCFDFLTRWQILAFVLYMVLLCFVNFQKIIDVEKCHWSLSTSWFYAVFICPMNLDHLFSSKVKVPSVLSSSLLLIDINFILKYELFLHFDKLLCWLTVQPLHQFHCTSCGRLCFQRDCIFEFNYIMTSKKITEPKMFVSGFTKYC